MNSHRWKSFSPGYIIDLSLTVAQGVDFRIDVPGTGKPVVRICKTAIYAPTLSNVVLPGTAIKILRQKVRLPHSCPESPCITMVIPVKTSS